MTQDPTAWPEAKQALVRSIQNETTLREMMTMMSRLLEEFHRVRGECVTSGAWLKTRTEIERLRQEVQFLREQMMASKSSPSREHGEGSEYEAGQLG